DRGGDRVGAHRRSADGDGRSREARMHQRPDERDGGRVRGRERALDVVVAHPPRREPELLPRLAEVREPDEKAEELFLLRRHAEARARLRTRRRITAIGRSTSAIASSGRACVHCTKRRSAVPDDASFETTTGKTRARRPRKSTAASHAQAVMVAMLATASASYKSAATGAWLGGSVGYPSREPT